MEQSRRVPTLVAAVRGGRGLNQPSRRPGLRQRCGAEGCGAEASRAEPGDSDVWVEVILIEEFKSHSRGDDFSFGGDSDERRRRALPNAARFFSLTDPELPLSLRR